MAITRRQLGKLALAGIPAAAVAGRYGSLIEVLAQARPNSLVGGVQIGTITYSYRSMPDQSAEATLKYIVDSGISAHRADGRTGRELRRRAEWRRGGGAGAAVAVRWRRRSRRGGGGGQRPRGASRAPADRR